jgi:cyclic pyranopterin phosphate synthase
MDVGGTIGWTRDAVVTADEILRRLNESGPLVRIPAIVPSEVARRFAWADGSGEIGIIASVTQPFCGDCVRLRLSAEGTLYSCLFATSGTSLRSALNERVPREELADRIRSTWVRRSDNYSEVRESRGLRGHLVQLGEKVRMSMVGG